MLELKRKRRRNALTETLEPDIRAVPSSEHFRLYCFSYEYASFHQQRKQVDDSRKTSGPSTGHDPNPGGRVQEGLKIATGSDQGRVGPGRLQTLTRPEPTVPDRGRSDP